MLSAGNTARAQTYGLATMQPGTLAHTAASAIAKVLKEKGGLNTLVQPTAGETVLIPMVAKGEIDLGIANMLEVLDGVETGQLQNDLRVIGSIYTLRIGFFSRKDSGIASVADLKGKRVPAGYSAMRTLDRNTLAMLATAGPHPQRREAGHGAERDPRRGRLPRRRQRHLHVLVRRSEGARGRRHRRRRARAGDRRHAARARGQPQGLPVSAISSRSTPGPVYVGVAQPMKAYAMDYVLFTNAKAKDDVVAKIIDTMVKNKPDMVAIAPIMNDFTAARNLSQAQPGLSSRRAEVLSGP